MEFYSAEEYIKAHLAPGDQTGEEYPRLYAEWKAYEKLKKKQLLADTRLRALAKVTPHEDLRTRDRWSDIRQKISSEQGGLCFWCATPLGDHWHLDHHVPRALGGRTCLDNLRALCIGCNQRKGRLLPGEFAVIMAQDLL